MSTTQNNKHIEDYLNYYVELPYSPRFAILLKGNWGSGKTSFIKNYHEKLNQTREKSFWTIVSTLPLSDLVKTAYDRKTRKKHKVNRCLYVSLNGLSSISDIDESIYQQLHPFWSSEQVKAVGTVMKSLLKGSLKIDLTNDGKDRTTWNIQVPDVPNNLEYLNFKEANSRVLIFDDLERCNIDTVEILGYINRFVEFQNLKVIVVADEEKIDKRDEKYRNIKEKTIGKTFEIYPDFQYALNDFLTQIENQKIRTIILNEFSLISSLFEKAKCTNLRILNQIILDFERIFNALPDKIVHQTDAIQEIIEVLTILSIEISSANIQAQEIDSIQKSLNDTLMSFVSSQVKNNKNSPTKDTDKKDLSDVFDKYEIKASFFTSKEWFPNLSWWKIFFDKGIVNKEILESVISNSKYFQDEKTPNWLKLTNYIKQSDEDFKIILEQVCLEYENRVFEDIDLIKQITGMLLFFSGARLYSKDKNEILEDGKQYIEFLMNQDKLNSKYSNKDNYMGTMFFAIDTDEFKEFNNFIKQKQEEIHSNNIFKQALQLMDTMMSDITAFHAKICMDSPIRTEERYYDFPIFSYLPPNIFLERLLSLSSNEDKQYVFYSLQKRYEFINSYPELAKELDFLKNFQDLLVKEVSNRQGVLSGFILGRLNSEYLAKTINLLEQKRT